MPFRNPNKRFSIYKYHISIICNFFKIQIIFNFHYNINIDCYYIALFSRRNHCVNCR